MTDKPRTATPSPASPQIRSMTGFARAVASTGGVSLEIEAKSVNNRFLEVNVRAPRVYSQYEREIRAAFQKHHKRGRIDLTVTRSRLPQAESPEDVLSPELDLLVARYAAACKRYGAGNEGLGNFLAKVVSRDLSSTEESTTASPEETACLIQVAERTSENLVEMREREGKWMADDIYLRLEKVAAYKDSIAEIAPQLPGRFKARLTERLETLSPGMPIDPARLAGEVALLADRLDVTEELTRLASHIDQFRTALGGHVEGVGRKLDFLMQEFTREFNTIGSKAQDAKIQAIVVDSKAELERIREQVQNVE